MHGQLSPYNHIVPSSCHVQCCRYSFLFLFYSLVYLLTLLCIYQLYFSVTLTHSVQHSGSPPARQHHHFSLSALSLSPSLFTLSPPAHSLSSPPSKLSSCSSCLGKSFFYIFYHSSTLILFLFILLYFILYYMILKLTISRSENSRKKILTHFGALTTY